jgi:hypothetical protein
MSDSESRRVAYEEIIAAEAQAKYRQKVRAENQRLARERLVQRGVPAAAITEAMWAEEHLRALNGPRCYAAAVRID